MITDSLKNASCYSKITPRIATAFRFLQKKNLTKLPVGRHKIDGTNIYAMVIDYKTKPKEKGVWEAHRRYIDVQYVAKGKELIGYANVKGLKAGPYHSKDDYLLLKGKGIFIPATAGTFVILMPQDAHMPGTAVGRPTKVRKVVVKVRF
jgi:YhcH/YjgK/YiaL family protein